MHSKTIYVPKGGLLPETTKVAIVGMRAADVIESRYLRSSENGRQAIIERIVGEYDEAGQWTLVIELDRLVPEPIIRSRKPDTVAFFPPADRMVMCRDGVRRYPAMLLPQGHA